MSNQRYYPRRKKKTTDWSKIANEVEVELELKAPVKFTDSEKVNENFEEWAKRFQDDWHNNVASINANNSIAQYNNFILERLSYAECSQLSTDTIIHNAITKYQNEIFRNGGRIIINDEIENPDDIIQKLEKQLKKFNVYQIIKEAVATSLTYGASSIFVDVNTNDLTKPLIVKKESIKVNTLKGFKVVPPYTMGALAVDTVNVLDKDYMTPSSWYIQGAGQVDSSRLLPVIIFKCPDLIKPVYNYGGISLVQFMKNYVSLADSTRQSLGDIILRFRHDTIKTELLKIDPLEAKARAESINRQKNNLGTMLLTEKEEYVQTITPLSGLDKISAHLMEYVSVSARMPSVKLFGLTPSGFNATGEFDLNSYNEEMEAMRNANIKPLMEFILRLFALEMELDIYPEYEFNEADNKSELEIAQIKNTYLDMGLKQVEIGTMDKEQFINYLKDNNVLPDSYELTEEDLSEFDEFDLDNPDTENINKVETII